MVNNYKNNEHYYKNIIISVPPTCSNLNNIYIIYTEFGKEPYITYYVLYFAYFLNTCPARKKLDFLNIYFDEDGNAQKGEAICIHIIKFYFILFYSRLKCTIIIQYIAKMVVAIGKYRKDMELAVKKARSKVIANKKRMYDRYKNANKLNKMYSLRRMKGNNLLLLY